MKFIYFDAFSGISGDMILGALLDLGVSQEKFISVISRLDLPVSINIKEVDRLSLRALKVDVDVTGGKRPQRKRKDVEKIIAGTSLSQNVKESASKIFEKLFAAEAKAHGKNKETTHLHEAGADDALVDILGTCYLLEILEVEKVYASPLNVGQGWTKSSHGVLPVPPPAVAEILKGIPVYSAHAKKELVTPTGAAIISTLAEKFLPLPELCYKKVGCGAGSSDFQELPNILRVFYGDADLNQPDHQIYIIETNLDDATPQILAAFSEKALELGALDVTLTPVTMKKNRLGTKLTILTDIKKMDKLIRAVFLETTSIGIRYYPVGRRVLERRTETVKLLGEEVHVKIASLEGQEVNILPEFEDCRSLAQKKNIPIKKIMADVIKEFNKK